MNNIKKQNYKRKSIFPRKMKRKLIKQGAGGFTVTLPIEWVRAHNLSGEEEVTIEESHGNLLIAAEYQQQERAMTFEIKNHNDSRIRTILASAYRRGYTTITLRSTEDFSYASMQRIVDTLLGLVIVKQSKREVIIKNILEVDTATLASVLQKFFTSITVLQEEVLEHMKEKKGAKEAEDLRISILKLRDYCQLIINKTAFQNDKCYEYYTLVFLAEKIAGCYVDMGRTKKAWSNHENELLRKKTDDFAALQSALFANKLEEAMRINTMLSDVRKKELKSVPVPLSMHTISEYLFALSSHVVALLI